MSSLLGGHHQNDSKWPHTQMADEEEKCNHNNDFFEMETPFVLNVINFRMMAGGVVALREFPFSCFRRLRSDQTFPSVLQTFRNHVNDSKIRRNFSQAILIFTKANIMLALP